MPLRRRRSDVEILQVRERHARRGDDLLLGQNDNDSLQGGKGNDTLSGGSGGDDLDGDASPLMATTVVHADATGVFNVNSNGLQFTFERDAGRISLASSSNTGQAIFFPDATRALIVIGDLGAGSFSIVVPDHQTDPASDHDIITGNNGGDTFHTTDSVSEMKDFSSLDHRS